MCIVQKNVHSCISIIVEFVNKVQTGKIWVGPAFQPFVLVPWLTAVKKIL